MSYSIIIFLSAVAVSLVVLWFLQRRAYNHLVKEGFSPTLPTTRTEGARFLSYCIRILIKKECAGVVPSKRLLMTLWLFVMSYPVIIAFLIIVYLNS
jgi:hypothetical protein